MASLDNNQSYRNRKFAEPPTGLPTMAHKSRTFRSYRFIRLVLAVSDVICVAVAFLVSYVLIHGWPARPLSIEEMTVVALASLLWVGLFRAFDLYDLQDMSPTKFGRVSGAVTLWLVLLIAAHYWLKPEFYRAWIIWSSFVALLLDLMVRRVFHQYLRRLRQMGRLRFRTLVVGSMPEAGRLAHMLCDPTSGHTPIGYVTPSYQSLYESESSLPVLGDIGDLHRLIPKHAVEYLSVLSSSIKDEDISRIAKIARQEGVEVRLSGNLTQTLTSQVSFKKVGRTIALSSRPVRLRRTQIAIKRAFDLVMASAALVVSLPLWAAIALAIRLSSPGPVFFRQERVTKGGRTFQMYKFRTMKVNTDGLLDVSAPFFKLQSDPRLTPIGRVIRRQSLDELPQFLNVLKGEMSLVGPRPLPADQVAANLELLRPRLEVPAGMTGWWQISGRSRTTPEEAVQLDQFYVEHWSLALDLYILMRTFSVLVVREAY